MDKSKPKHPTQSTDWSRWHRQLRRRAVTLSLLVSLGWLIRPQPELARASAHVSGEFPAWRPNDSQEFARIRAAAFRLPRLKPKPKPVPEEKKRKTPMIRPAPSRLALLLTIAKQYIGVRYVWGGNTPSGFDCSGYTRYVYRKVGVVLPRVSRDQANVGDAVSGLSNARVGDLLFFGSPIHHVAIYIGRGLMLDAPHTGSYVQIRKVYDTPSVIRRVL